MKTTALLIIILLAGCSLNTSKETLTISIPPESDQITLQYTNEIAQVLFLYYTDTKQVNHTSPLSSLSVGEIESKPDTESLSPFWKAIIAAMK
jgi:hypothetical protein